MLRLLQYLTMGRLFLIGLDGAEPTLLRAWMAQGYLPHLQSLARRGTFIPCASTVPPATFPAWTTCVTGVNPGGHGIFDFTQIVPGAYRIQFVNGTWRRAPALWNILSDAGKRVCVLGVPATYPPEAVNGCMVAGFDSPVCTGIDATFVYPRDWFGLVKDWPFADFQETDLKPGWHATALGKLLAGIETKETIALEMLRREPWDFFMVVFGESDTVSHHFWQFHDTQSPRRYGGAESPPERRGSRWPGGRSEASLATPEKSEASLATPEKSEASLATPEKSEASLATPEKSEASLATPEKGEASLATPEKSEASLATPEKSEASLGTPEKSEASLATPEKGEASLAAPEDDPILQVYRRLDAAVGRIMEFAGADTTVVVVSDHGFGGSGTGVVQMNNWLAAQGELRWLRGGRRSLLKEAALRLAPESWRGALFRRFAGLAAQAESAARVAGIDFGGTRAWSEELNYFPSVRINVRGREPQGIVDPEEYEGYRKALCRRLEAWHAVARAYCREELYSGPYVDSAPDIILALALEDGYSHSFLRSHGKESFRRLEPPEYAGGKEKGMAGNHRPSGVLFLSKPTVAGAASLLDVAPTVLADMGVAGPPMEGTPLVGAHRETAASALLSEPQHYTPAQEAEIERRLRNLGYFE
jgi:predicted AlkP superfamily phosphohydrolase/phosphomutase